MLIFTTTIRATDPITGMLKTWAGPNVPGINFSDAQAYCENNGLGYCKVDGLLVAEIDEQTGAMRHYDRELLN